MNDDFEEDYEEDDDGDIVDDVKELKDKVNDLKDKINDKEGKKSKGDKSQTTSNNDPTAHNEAREFNKSQNAKNQARTQNPSGNRVAQETGKKAAQEGGKKAAQEGGKKAAQEAGKKAAQEGGKKVAKEAGKQVAKAGAKTAAKAGAKTAVKFIPYVGWAIAIIDAIIQILKAAKKLQKKMDKKAGESGVDTKGIRRLLKLSPILLIMLPILLILLIVVLVDSETHEKVDLMAQATSCFEGTMIDKSCRDFMGTKLPITIQNKPFIKATDWEIAQFVFEYIMIENKYYGSGGSSFMTDIVNDLEDVAKGDILEDQDRSIWDKISNKFQELVDKSIFGAENYAWNLMKWIKMEKKVFNNIEWYKEYANTGTGVATVDKIKQWASAGLLKTEPNIGFVDTSRREPWTAGFHGFDTAYLKVPIGINMDTAIETVKLYIPSWIEIYATLVATGDYKLCNSMYNYYISDDYNLEVTIYELLTVRKTQKIKSVETTDYYIDKGKGNGRKQLTEDEVAGLKDTSKRNLWDWLGDALTNFISDVKNKLNDLVEKVKDLLGFNVSVSADYTLIVTKGNAYKYTIDQKYNIYTEKTETTKPNAESKSVQEQHTVEYKETEEVITLGDNGEEVVETVEKKYNAKLHVITRVNMDYKITTWVNKLKYNNAYVGEYEEMNRYVQVFTDMVDKYGYKYTVDDVAIAIEAIEVYYGEDYVSKGMSIDYSALPEGEFGWPVPANKVVSALFGNTAWYGSNHGGIDIWAVGNDGKPSASFTLVKRVDIVAAQAGKVVTAFDGGCADGNKVSEACAGGYGNYVKIQHDNNYATIYAHLSPGTIAVSVGQEVIAGQYLGKMGSSGNSSGTHLHYEIQFSGTRLDPLAFYDVVPNEYALPYAQRDNSKITMANPYRVNFVSGSGGGGAPINITGVNIENYER